jgi:Asp/Glu/hydantoin racemase
MQLQQLQHAGPRTSALTLLRMLERTGKDATKSATAAMNRITRSTNAIFVAQCIACFGGMPVLASSPGNSTSGHILQAVAGACQQVMNVCKQSCLQSFASHACVHTTVTRPGQCRVHRVSNSLHSLPDGLAATKGSAAG